MARKKKPVGKKRPAKKKPKRPPAKPKVKKTRKRRSKPKSNAKPKPPPKPKSTAADYERFKQQQASISLERSAKGRDIGPLPAVVNQARRDAALASLRTYCETYKRQRFSLAWSADHLEAIAMIEKTILAGGMFAQAMQRGGGKTEVIRAAVEWAVLKGLLKFALVIGATDDLAADLLRDIKLTFERNDLLYEDFPEVCHPVRRLEGMAQKQRGQLLDGVRTEILWSTDEIRLPRVPGSACSGAAIRTRSITGAIRGANITAEDGQSMRPDLIVLDDCQTRESAKSPTQTSDREKIIDGDVMELAGPETQIRMFMLCTVIYKNDLSEKYLDRQRKPQWRGRRFKAIYSFPENNDLWNKYAEIRADSFRNGGDGSEATAFYAANREEMDRGAVVGWPARMRPGEISGLQSMMNRRIDNPESFAAEMQNEPQQETMSEEARQIEESDLARKLNHLSRGIVARECNRLTAFIDIQAEILFWGVCAWTDRFGGALVDYGAWPEQPRSVFTAANPDRKLEHLYPGRERDARIYAALSELVPRLMSRAWKQDGAEGSPSVSLCMIDAGFVTEVVHDFIGRSPLRAVLKPSKGKAVGPAGKPMNDYRKDAGDLMGWNWRIDAKTQGKGRFVSYDTYPWKSFVAEAILAPAGAAGSFYLPGSDLQADHPLLTVHLLSEYRVPTWGQGRRVEVWKPRPDQRENHWFDAVIGCAVGASVLGVNASPSGEAVVKQEAAKIDHRAEYEKQRRAFEARRGF